MPDQKAIIYPENENPKDKTKAAKIAIENIDYQEKLNNLAVKTDRILFKISSTFPFDLFPDSIIIDENKTNIIKRDFFGVKQIYTILHKDLIGITLSTSIIFASLTFEIVGLETNPPPIRYLIKPQAIKARRFLLGLAAAAKQEIDVGKIDFPELSNQVQEIGKSFEHPKIK